MQNWLRPRHFAELAVVLALALCPACGGRSDDEANLADETTPATALKPVAVETAQAVARIVPAYLPATGSFVADETSDVAPQISGQVIATPVDVGDYVRAGAVLARLDDRDARLRVTQAEAAEQQAAAALRQAQARLGLNGAQSFEANQVPEVRAARQQYEAAEAQARLAETNATRYGNLLETGDVARSVYDQARAQAATARAQANAARQQYEAALNTARQSNQGVGVAQAALASARAQTALARKTLSDTVIRAPISGFISDRPAAPGESVSPTTKIATIQRLQPLKLQLQLPEGNASQVALGMAVLATVAAFPDREFSGRVTALNPAIELTSRTISVEAEFPNTDLVLRPGMFASARLLRPAGERAVFVPANAVMNDPSTNTAHVFVIKNGTARVQIVQTGLSADGLVRITAGLSGGETVAANQLERLFDGATIAISNARTAAR